MNFNGRRRAFLLTSAALAAGRAARAQTREASHRLALPGYEYAFPRDHGAHPEFRLEWWYFTGHLDAGGGGSFGYELTFFRVGMDRRSDNPSAWRVDDLYMAHFAITDPARASFRFHERLNRRGPGIAHALEGTLDVRNGSWTARLDQETIALRAAGGGLLLELDLRPARPPVVHGTDGISRKGDGVGRASHYYSLTRLETRGLLGIDGEAFPVTGESWMDHEFGTNQLADDQTGWDWFSLQLDNGADLMIYVLRRADLSRDPNSSGTAVAPDGTVTHLIAEEFAVESMRRWPSPKSDAVYPLDWTIRLRQPEAELGLVPLMDDQELVTTRSTGIAYWEGAVHVEGAWEGQPVRGRGYVELTGYSEESRPDI
jgi:predicted secreted hydrolase